MNLRNGRAQTESTRPALDLISLACMTPESARQQLRSLLIANPNYFAKLSESSFQAVLQIQEDTTYERLSNVTFNPALNQMCASLEIRLNTGYSDGRSPSSQEYVRFYVSFDEGATWVDQGVRGLLMCDDSGARPMEQMIRMQMRPLETELCSESLPRIRAILSWNQIPPPSSPGWLPVWGNVVESNLWSESETFLPAELAQSAQRTGFSRGYQVEEGEPASPAVAGFDAHTPTPLSAAFAFSDILHTTGSGAHCSRSARAAIAHSLYALGSEIHGFWPFRSVQEALNAP